MMPVCKFYKQGNCTNPECRFRHPKEYPVYIYTVPGVDIHPDELRTVVMSNSTAAHEADMIWLENYKYFCLNAREDDAIDVYDSPEYFSRPFDPGFVKQEIANMKRNGVIVKRQPVSSGIENERSDWGLPNRGAGYETRNKANGYNTRDYSQKEYRGNSKYSGGHGSNSGFRYRAYEENYRGGPNMQRSQNITDDHYRGVKDMGRTETTPGDEWGGTFKKQGGFQEGNSDIDREDTGEYTYKDVPYSYRK